MQISRFLSYILRHRPDQIGLTLDANGWVSINDLLAACERHGRSISWEELMTVVANNNKRRFAISKDGKRIRASQGHSVAVDLGYEPAVPPNLLYHGTATRFLELIRVHGLRRGSRQHVHLSADAETARTVGARHGEPVVLTIRAGALAAKGAIFYLSANGVWLTEYVPPNFIAEDTGSLIC